MGAISYLIESDPLPTSPLQGEEARASRFPPPARGRDRVGVYDLQDCHAGFNLITRYDSR